MEQDSKCREGSVHAAAGDDDRSLSCQDSGECREHVIRTYSQRPCSQSVPRALHEGSVFLSCNSAFILKLLKQTQK